MNLDSSFHKHCLGSGSKSVFFRFGWLINWLCDSLLRPAGLPASPSWHRSRYIYPM
jgi:hypothetical protein